MRLLCTVAVGNRLLSELSIKCHHKHVKSTLALCRHPKNENEFMIIHFTTQNRTGTKYKINDNLNGVSTRFIAEGKVTIQFKEPSHNLHIQADVIQLKSFLHFLQRVVEKKVSANERVASSMSVTPISKSKYQKLIITRRSELPIHGFNRTLEVLHINGISLEKLCIGVLQLQKLRILDISDNCIEYLPAELNTLPIQELNVSKNQLGKGYQKWNWIGGVFPQTLKILNLSYNNLTFLPEQIVKLQALTYINLNNNKLEILPSGFGNFRNLRTLKLSDNYLTRVPGSMKRLHLEYVDLSRNRFRPVIIPGAFPKTLPVYSLKECAARKVLQAKLPYNAETIPFTLVDYLDYAFYCDCGKACFEVYFRHASILLLESITHSFVSVSRSMNYIPVDCYYCSNRCFRRMIYSLT